jgi:1,2-phenylacetyl-CoA epoxidase catalytic subunit
VFPIDKRLVHVVMYPAPDVVPEVLFAVEDIPRSLWDAQDDLYELAEVMAPYLARHGARKWDFLWSMERHFSEPYGPLPPARQTFMAGVPDMFLSEKPTDVDILAEPFQYDVGSEMPEEFVFWLRKLMFAHGECMMPYFGPDAEGRDLGNAYALLDEWRLFASPDAATRLRVNNFAAEEFKHTYQFYRLYHDFDPSLPVEIHEHEKTVFRAYLAMDVQQTWLDHSLNSLMNDRFGVFQGFEWVRSAYAPLSRVSLKIVKDERGHSNMGYISVRQCLEQDPDARLTAQARIHDYLYPYFLAAFGSDDSANNTSWRRWGLKQHTNAQLRNAYHQEMVNVLTSLGLEPPDPDKALERGREMAEMARSAATQ